jgi:hypothetical protein
MNANIVERDGKKFLVVEIEMTPPTPSASGKTYSVASSHGNMPTTATVDGKPVIVGLNAYIKHAAPSAAVS